MKKVTRNEYLPYQESMKLVKEYGFKSIIDYYKNRKKLGLVPYNPDIIYKDEWTSWEFYLGIKVRKLRYDFIPYDDAKKILSELKIYTIVEYEELVRTRKDLNLPWVPRRIYTKEWVNWRSFLGEDFYKYGTHNKTPYFEFIRVTREAGIQNLREYKDFILKNPELNFPHNPTGKYQKKQAELFGEKYKKRSSVVDFETAMRTIRKNSLRTVAQYLQFRKDRPECRLPASPSITYSGKGWVSWVHFLRSEQFKEELSKAA